MTDQEFDIQYGFAEGLKAIDRARKAGRKIIENDTSFEWEDGFVKKDFIRNEAELSKEMYAKFLLVLL